MGTLLSARTFGVTRTKKRLSMNAIIYLVGLVVIIMFILSVIGLR